MTMGKNRNCEKPTNFTAILHSFVVCAFNRTVSKVHEFLQNEAKGSKIVGAESLEEMVKLLKPPRRIVLLVKAGTAVQAFIDNLVPLLAKGSVLT